MTSSNSLLQARNISLHIGKTPILQSISLDINAGEIIGLIGPNGAGKTSLLKILANINTQYEGSYHFDNKPITAYSIKELAKHFGYLAQDATAHWPLQVKKVIELGRLPFQGMVSRLSKKDSIAIEKAIAQTEVAQLLDRIVTQLSGGERTRVFLARLFAAESRILFVDEPIASLDPYHQLHVMEILQAHAHNGGTVVIVLHDLNLAARFCDRLMLLDKGRIVGTGNINNLLKDNKLADIYGITIKTFCDDEGYALTPLSRQ